MVGERKINKTTAPSRGDSLSDAIEKFFFFAFDGPVKCSFDAGAGDSVSNLGIASLGFFAFPVSETIAWKFIVPGATPTVFIAHSVRFHGLILLRGRCDDHMKPLKADTYQADKENF
ncbi:MAG: hypothetical protein HQL07_03930 [Nitrospirae bacterium]|nr:hypothetical protein [Magnetococcales bacterium]